ncbi:hypothetical protein C8R47DRAFT_1071688 [Mycena vitilis]|nr:hypothetical protein C8R47DRAFT_1071688 [Mycena vitilis]
MHGKAVFLLWKYFHSALTKPSTPGIREKNRLYMQERRATVKAKRRQWDPPKQATSVEGVHEGVRARSPSASVDTRLLSSEALYGALVFQDPRGAPTSADEDSEFRRTDLRRRVGTESSEVNVPPASGAGQLIDEQMALRALPPMGAGHIGGSQDSVLRMANLLSSDESDHNDDEPTRAAQPSTSVASALASVARLNASLLTPPTAIEARRWERKTFGFWGHFLQYRKHNVILSWRDNVCVETTQSGVV